MRKVEEACGRAATDDQVSDRISTSDNQPNHTNHLASCNRIAISCANAGLEL